MPCDRIGEVRLSGRIVWGSSIIESVPFPAISLIVNPSTNLITTAGQVVDYQYVISNDGKVVLHDVAVTDDNVDAPPVCDFFANDELAPRGEMHSKVICTAHHSVTQEEMQAGGHLVNHVSVTSDEVGPVNSTVKVPIGIFVNGFEGQTNTLTVLDNTSCDVGRDSSIAIGADGYPVISYYDLIEGTVKFIKCTDLACAGRDEVFSIVDGSSNGRTSLALGDDDLPAVAHATYGQGGVTYLTIAKCNDSGCSGGDESITVVDGPGDSLAYYNLLAIGNDGYPVISSFDQQSLHVVKCNDAACTGGDETVTIVDASPGAPGAYSSLAIGADGQPVISYQQVDPGLLKVAKCNDPACAGGDEIITVLDDSTDHAGRFTSIAIGTDGFPVISYSNEYDWELRVVKCNDLACSGGDETRSVVDNLARGFTSIAIGDDGLPVIAYTGEGSKFALKVVKCNDPACSGNDETTHVVDRTSTGYVSMTIGSDGLPIISYFDNQKMVLKVAHCGNSSCSQ